jgi:predicted secreted protein
MLKAIFLALICLFGMTAALALRPNGNAAPGTAALTSRDLTTAVADDLGDTFSVNTISKADRLPVVFLDSETKKVATNPIQATPIQVESKPEPAKPQITSWHWHAGSKTITRK